MHKRVSINVNVVFSQYDLVHRFFAFSLRSARTEINVKTTTVDKKNPGRLVQNLFGFTPRDYFSYVGQLSPSHWVECLGDVRVLGIRGRRRPRAMSEYLKTTIR
jgi:hypothetical protein